MLGCRLNGFIYLVGKTSKTDTELTITIPVRHPSDCVHIIMTCAIFHFLFFISVTVSPSKHVSCELKKSVPDPAALFFSGSVTHLLSYSNVLVWDDKKKKKKLYLVVMQCVERRRRRRQDR